MKDRHLIQRSGKAIQPLVPLLLRSLAVIPRAVACKEIGIDAYLKEQG